MCLDPSLLKKHPGVPIQKIDLEGIGDPFYAGSVQNLYAIAGRSDLMLCETTSGGSAFDVGTIFRIENSDLTRAIFRHRVFTDLENPDCVAELVDELKSGRGEMKLLAEWLDQPWVKRVRREGIRTHHVGMVDAETGAVTSGAFPEHPSTFNAVKRFQIIKPEHVKLPYGWAYDYTPYQGQDRFVIPLEFIVRLGVTSNSSIYRKYLKLGAAERAEYAKSLGAGRGLRAWEYFPTPIYDLTTKYEPEDRNLNNQEALIISTLTGAQFNENVLTAILCTAHVAKLLSGTGLRLWDIKWEFARAEGSLYVVDTIDTDSLRATFTVEEGEDRFITHFNKQSIRDFYRIEHAAWLNGVNEAKALASGGGEPFTAILAAGQAEGKYPATPEIEGRFLQLQTRKMELIADFLLGETSSADARKAVEELAGEELEYYRNGTHFEEFKKVNRI